MFKLDTSVRDLGLLIGLLKDAGNGNVSVNEDWFRDPVGQLESSPTRVQGLLSVINSSFNPVPGTEFATLDQNETWYSIYSGLDSLPTGLCLVAPKVGSNSGVISLGLFNQLSIQNLTISMHAKLPLFFLKEGQVPQFIPASMASDLAERKKLEIAIEACSPSSSPVGTFNLMAATATVNFDDSFQTKFDLSFYENFDLKTRSKTAATVDVVSRLDELVNQGSYWLATYIGDSPMTIGDLLAATGLVKQVRDSAGITTYSFEQAGFDNLKSKGPTAVLTDFLVRVVRDLLDQLVQADEPLVAVEGGGIYVAQDDSNAYGLRLEIPDFQLTASDSSGAKVVVQLGKWFTGELDGKGWIQRISNPQAQPGIELLFLKYDGTTLSTTGHFELNSIGIDIRGPGDTPLINLGGYTLKGAELRTYLDSDGWQHGFAIRLDDVSFPMGPNFDQTQSGSADTNVVAQNLLAASGGSSPGATDAVNPGFSADALYISGKDPRFEIFGPEGNKTDLIWFPIQRRFGPIDCQKIGLKLDSTGSHQHDPMLGVVFDGDVALGQLDIYLDQLSLSAHLNDIGNVSGYDLDLQGLDVTFSNGSVEVSAGLMKNSDPGQPVSYDGEALIKTADLTVAAIGSYCSLPGGGTSMFIFGVLNKPIGGPPCFYVTGLMAGFGYNRSLRIPDQNEVTSFPLLAGLLDPTQIGGANPTPAQALSALSSPVPWVPPERGEYWLAAGVQFTTFEIIKTNALLIVEFGNSLSIAILGISTLKQPQFGPTYVYAELGIEVVLLPEQGEFKASAVLAPSSYLLTPDAQMTGGFAFYSWFGNSEHSGDFVFTVGGYHPAFQIPVHYPQEPRVGINWHISDHLSMVGDAYFALTPSAMMAGCGLQVTYHDGDLKAWLKMRADILIYWKPFYVIADISLSVGVSDRISLYFTHVTVSAEIGADFHLWGPPIGGKVHIDWYIISFSISFGSDKNPPSEISWADFKEMLPAKPHTESSTPSRAASRTLVRAAAQSTSATTTDQPAYIHINVSDGLIRTHDSDGLTFWLVRPNLFKFTAGSALPASVIVVESQHSTDNQTIQGNKVGIQRVNGGIAPDNYRSQQTVTILKLTNDDSGHIKACMATPANCSTQPPGCGEIPAEIGGWEIDPVTKDLPTAMWGTPASSTPSINSNSSTVAGTTGVTMYPKPPVITNCTPQMVVDNLFADRTVNPDAQYMLPLSQTAPPSDNPPQPVDSFADIRHINDAAVVQKRAKVYAALQALGINAWTNDPMAALAATPEQGFADEPMEGATVLSQAQ